LFSDTHLQAFESAIRKLGVNAYLCGGTVRDLLLGRPFRDVDVVLSDHVFEAAQLFRAAINAPYFVLDEERQIARVVCRQGNWDFSAFRDSTIEGDLEKRDFTINAIALPWKDFFPDRSLQPVIDPFSGAADLKRKIIRPVTETSLQDDPLRMVRAFRIHAELDFEIDPAIHKQIEKWHPLISAVSTERITEEFDRLFLQPDSAVTWKLIGDSPLFGSLFPEILPTKGCEQGGYHHLDVWSHSLLTLQNFEKLLLDIPAIFPEYQEPLLEYIAAIPGTLDRRRLLKWAAIFHDIGKPQTRELKEPGRWRFHGHDHAGAALAETLLKRLKFARKDLQLISVVIQQHLRPLNLFNQKDRTTNDIYRFFRASGPEALGILLIASADMSAARGTAADPARDSEFIHMCKELFEYYFKEYYPAVNTPELVKGRDLMAFFQMKPGPLMGELLREIREAQLEGKLRTRQEAMDFAQTWLKNR